MVTLPEVDPSFCSSSFAVSKCTPLVQAPYLAHRLGCRLRFSRDQAMQHPGNAFLGEGSDDRVAERSRGGRPKKSREKIWSENNVTDKNKNTRKKKVELRFLSPSCGRPRWFVCLSGFVLGALHSQTSLITSEQGLYGLGGPCQACCHCDRDIHWCHTLKPPIVKACEKQHTRKMADSADVPYDPSSAAAAPAAAPPVVAVSGGRGRGRGRGRGGGGVAIEGIAELDASMGRGAPIPPAGGGGKPLPPKKDFRGPAGLFKQGDWTCTVCGNVNWERRSTCNQCQNAKPNLAGTDEVSWFARSTETRFGSFLVRLFTAGA